MYTLKQTIKRLNQTTLSQVQISKGTDLSLRFLGSVKAGESKDFGIRKIELLNKYLDKNDPAFSDQ